MNHLEYAIVGYTLGFLTAVLSICRVNLRPRSKRILQKANLLPKRKAVVPRKADDLLGFLE